MISRLLVPLLIVLFFPHLSAQVDLDFDYADNPAGVVFEVERAGTSGTWDPVDMGAPVPVASETPGVPRFRLTHATVNEHSGRWRYRLRAVKNASPSAWVTVLPSPVDLPPRSPEKPRIGPRSGTTTTTATGAP